MSELEIWNELGNIYYNAEAYDEAIRAYHKAIELDHGCAQSFSNLASIYIHKQFYAEAILMYQKGIELLIDPADKAVLWNRLGDAYLRVDDYNNAIVAYKTATDLDPDNPSLKNDLAKVKLGSAHSFSIEDLAAPQTPAAAEFIQAPPEPPLAESAYLPSEEAPAITPDSKEIESGAEMETVDPELVSKIVIETRMETGLAPETPSISSDSSVAGSTSPESTEMLANGTAPQENGIEPEIHSETAPETPSNLSDLAIPESTCPESLETIAPISVLKETDIESEIGTETAPETLSSLSDPAIPETASLESPQISTSLSDLQVVESPCFEPLVTPATGAAPNEIKMETETTPVTASIVSASAEEGSVYLQAQEPFAAEADLNESEFEAEIEAEMEPESLPEAASIQSGLPESSEPEAACWVFKSYGQPVQVDTDENSSTEKPPLILGSRILSEEPSEEALADVMEPAVEAPVLVKAEATDVSDQNIAGILNSSEFTDIRVSDHFDCTSKELPAIEPHMGEPINSRASALMKLGLLHWRRGDYEGALQFLKTALNLAAVFFDNQFEALCFNAIALVETDLGNAGEAIRAYENAVSFDPEQFFPWNNLGYLYSKDGRYEEAQVAFKKAIEHDPKDPLSWNGIGDVYHKLGRFEDAISAYQLGNVFDRRAIEETAHKLGQIVLDSDEENPRILEEMGNIDFIHGAYDDAISAFSNALDLVEAATDKARLWKRLGETYLRLNEDDNATAAYQKAVEFGQENFPLQEAATGTATAVESIDPESLPEPSAPIVVESSPTVLLSTEPSDADPLIPEPEDVVEIEPAPTETGPVEDERIVPKILPFLSEPVESPDPEPAPEPEAAYWVFKTDTPAGDAHRPQTQFRTTPEPKGNTKPSPAFVLPKFPGQALLENHLMTETYDDATVMVVEQTPLKENLARLDYARSFTPHADRVTPITDAQPATIEFPLEEPQDLDLANPAEVVTIDHIANQIGANIHTLEKDIAAYRKVTEVNPLNDRAWDALGNMYEATGLHNEAINAFEKAISLASQREVYHYHLGLAHAAQKHFDKAIRSLQKVVALNPDYMLAHCALAGYYRRIGKEAEAKEHIAIARPYIERENDYNQACFESICGNTERALTFLRSALAKKQIQVELVRGDPDLDFIRNDPRFEELIIKNRNIIL